MSRTVRIAGVSVLLILASNASAALVWQSDFTSSVDGVVNVKDRDTTKAMIGPVSGGRLQITTKDKSLAFNANDRAGRPLGATLNGGNSMSALYKFNWSSLSNTTTTWEGFGFIGSDACPTTCTCSPNVCNTTRQVLGGLLQHRYDSLSGNYSLIVGIEFGESGAGNHFYKGGAEINLGATPQLNDYYFAIGYDGTSHVLSIAFYNSSGNVLSTVSQDLDSTPGGLVPSTGNTVQTMLNNLQLTHLGWNDYVAAGNNVTTVWQVDQLIYFNDARGAFNAVPNAVTAACCLPVGTCGEGYSDLGCVASGGTAGATTCAFTTCPTPVGACCKPDGSCSEGTAADCATQGGTYQGNNSACSLTSCPQPPTGACCAALDGSCTDGKTQYNCNGTWQGAATLCATTTCPPPAAGACCLPNGACISVSTEACTQQCGTFTSPGTTCGAAGCPQIPVGACCLPNGTCSLTTEQNCAGAFRGSGTNCAAADCRPMPNLVWWSNFADGADGMVDVTDNDPTKELIGPQCDGQLPLHTRSFPSSWELNDRSGRPVGGTLNGNNSFSALYRFRWNDLPEDQPVMVDFPSFFGERSNATQQVLGTMLVHNKVGADYYVRMCSAAGELQYYFLFQCGTTFNLGPDAETTDYQLVVSYNGQTHLLSHAIYDNAGQLLGTVPSQSFQSFDLDTSCPTEPSCQNYFDPTPPQTTKQEKYDALALTHVGLAEYSSLSGTDQHNHWLLNSLGYFNDAAGAYNAVYGTPARGACCRGDGSCVEADTEQACIAAGGGWGGAGSTCGTTVCQGACCLPDGSCIDNQTVPGCNAAAGTFAGLNTTCATTSCPLPPCHGPFADADNDGDVDLNDFGVMQACFTGPGGQYTNAGTCHCFDRDGDSDIDGDDFVRFQNCATRANLPADPGCDTP